MSSRERFWDLSSSRKVTVSPVSAVCVGSRHFDAAAHRVAITRLDIVESVVQCHASLNAFSTKRRASRSAAPDTHRLPHRAARPAAEMRVD